MMFLRVFLVFLFAFAARPVLGQAGGTIAGDYLEARSNHVYTCGCLYSGEMVTDGREAILAWNFESGSFRGAPLAGVKVLAVLTADGNLSVEGRERSSLLYFDPAASEAQRQAVLSLFEQQYPALVGHILGTRTASIAFRKEPGSWNVESPGMATVTMRAARLPDDAHQGSSLWYGPFIPLADSTLAMTLLYEYRGNGLGRQWWRREPGITGYFGRFVLTP